MFHFREFLKKAKALWQSWVGSSAHEYARPAVGQVAIARAEATPSSSKVDRATAAFHFRETILDDLGIYFKCLRHMKNNDREGYDFYSKVGAHLLPNQNAFIETDGLFNGKLNAWFRKNRPTFGAVAFGVNKDLLADEKVRNKINPRFIYFRKYDRASVRTRLAIPVTDGDIYLITVYYDLVDTEHKRGIPVEYGVIVGRDGTVSVLKQLCSELVSVRSRRGQSRGKTFTIPKRDWGLPPILKEWAKEHERDAYEFFASYFSFAANMYADASHTFTRVNVEKDGLSAVFGVDIKRTPYFFRDRDVTISAESGSRRRIFHIVRPHKRQTKAGDRYIRMHFRGERSFRWNGYDVLITVPGKHHAPLTALTAGYRSWDSREPKPSGWKDESALARLINKVVREAA